MKKTILALSLLCAACLYSGAQTVPSLLIGYGAAESGYAGASVASVAGARAVDVNPAAMSLYDGTMAVSVSGGIWQPDAASDIMVGASGFACLGEKFAIGAGFKLFNQPSYEVVSGNGAYSQVDGKFTPSDLSVSLGASYFIGGGLSAGITARYISSSLAGNAKASSVMADIALAYSASGLNAALVVANLGGGLKYSETSYSLPSLVKAGVSYDIIKDLRAMAEVDYLFEGAMMASLGCEYWIRDIVAARLGYHYGDEAKAIPSYASGGLGVKFKGVSLDASYLFASETLGGSMVFTLGYSF